MQLLIATAPLHCLEIIIKSFCQRSRPLLVKTAAAMDTTANSIVGCFLHNQYDLMMLAGVEIRSFSAILAALIRCLV